MSRRLVLGAVAVAVVVVAAVVVGITVGSGHQAGMGSGLAAGQGSAGASASVAPVAAASGVPSAAPIGPVLGPARESLVPASGAYLGAYVEATPDTQQGQINAVLSFEHQLGHPIALVHVYHPWGADFPSKADKYFVDSGKILLLTWGGDPDTQAIIAGKDDAMIRARAEAIKALGHPIMLEFRHEMDRPNLQWTIHGPADYIAAWDHVRAIFKSVGATNVSWVWCPTGYGFQLGRAQAFYPGNQEVDWVCADVYSDSTAQSLGQAAGPFLRWASHHDKPVIIGEFAADGEPADWPAWLTAAGQLARQDPQIKAMAYFDGDGVDSQGRPFQYWLASQPSALAAFGRLAAEPYFQPAVRNDP